MSQLVRGRDARAELPPPILTLAVNRHHTAATILRAWRESKSEATIRSYEHDLTTFADFLSAAVAVPLTIEAALTRFFQQSSPAAHETLLYFRSHLQRRGLAPASINRCLAALRSVGKLARSLGVCSFMLETPGVRLEKRRDTRGPTVDQVRQILGTFTDDDEASTRDAAIVTVFFCCGLRCAELCGMDWQTTDSARETAWIRGKGRAERELIPLPTPAIAAIQRYAKHRGTVAGPLFRTRGRRGQHRDGRLETRSVARIVREAGARIGIRLWPHALRHASISAAASAGAKDGISLDKIRAHSRHANLSTLQNYLDNHDREATQRRIVTLLGEQLTAGQ